jgi:hypothetical protein
MIRMRTFGSSKFYHVIVCTIILLISAPHILNAGQLADRVFAYQSWTTLQADCVVDTNGDSANAMTMAICRDSTGNVAYRYTGGFEILADGQYSRMQNGQMAADHQDATQIPACFLASQLCITPDLIPNVDIVKEAGDQLWLSFTGFDGWPVAQLTSDASGKVSQIVSDFAVIDSMVYVATASGMALQSWTTHLKLPQVPAGFQVTNPPVEPVLHFNLSNIRLNQTLGADAFATH